jgi:two-component system invasion response regulator UvrY
MQTSPIRVGIADDHVIVRSALRQVLEMEDHIRVVAETEDGRGAIDMVHQTPLDVLILDLAMPGHSGLDVIGMLRAKAPDVGILVLSSHPEQQYAVNMLRLGASGYLNKQCEPEEIVHAVKSISGGQRYLSPRVACLLAEQLERAPARPPHEKLSDREFQVFLKLAQGERAREIGRELSLSPKTVSAYRCKLLDKLGLQTNSELTRYALDHRLID